MRRNYWIRNYRTIWIFSSIRFPGCSGQQGPWRVRHRLGNPFCHRDARSNPWRGEKAREVSIRPVSQSLVAWSSWWERYRRRDDKEVGANKERRSDGILRAPSPQISYSATHQLQGTALCKLPPRGSPSRQHVSTACSHSPPWTGTLHPDDSTPAPQYLRCTMNAMNPCACDFKKWI